MENYKLSYTASEINERLGQIGASSWNDLTDKPFGEEVTEAVVEFDGDLTGWEYVDFGGLCYVKRSNKILTEQDVIGETLTYFEGGNTVAITVDDTNILAHDNTMHFDVAITNGATGTPLVISGENIELMGTTFSSGTYFLFIPDAVYAISISCLTGEVVTIKPIDEKYLPESVPAIQTAEVGQVIAVKAVDENGKPTEWEAVAAGGGNSDIVVVTLSQETMKLSHTPAEILSLLQAGKIVLCSVTHAGFTCDSDGKSATTVAIAAAFGEICVVKYDFDESGTMSSRNMYKVSVTEK